MTSEFSLIERYFARPTPSAVMGVGDDAALLQVTAGMHLAVSSDMLVAGTHFFPDADPRKLGWKTLAVNISDLAAMGAQPRWATLALSLPQIDDIWLAAFADGLFECAGQFDVELVGGDTTRGPLSMSVTILGEVPTHQALRRDAARLGDDIWVSGTLGGAALGLTALQGKVAIDESDRAHCLRALETPQPRVALGMALRAVAHAAIDISDGLLADLGHILERSQVGASICLEDLPVHPALLSRLDSEYGMDCLMSGGDDYELCFTASSERRNTIQALGVQLNLPLTRIGIIQQGEGLMVVNAAGDPVETQRAGYDHFA